eukprot:80863_1
MIQLFKHHNYNIHQYIGKHNKANNTTKMIKCNGQFPECESAERIKLILQRYNKIASDKTDKHDEQLQNETNKLMHNIETNGQYSNIELLNDFYHIKYKPNVNDNSYKFNLF